MHDGLGLFGLLVFIVMLVGAGLGILAEDNRSDDKGAINYKAMGWFIAIFCLLILLLIVYSKQ
jgi:hypothetical protein